MKKLLIVWLSFCCGISVVAQDKGSQTPADKYEFVPGVVKQAFIKDYPQAKEVKWTDEGNLFEAEFELNEEDCSAHYDKSGTRKEFEVDINSSQLPLEAQIYLKDTYEGLEVTQAAKVTDDQNVMTYEADVKINGEPMEFIFDLKGKFVGQVRGIGP